MDSRAYISAFTIEGERDVPPDFVLPSGLVNPRAGLFLPQDEPGFLARRRFPARVILLTGDALWIIHHPTAEARPVRVQFEDLAVLECGRIVLLGWIRIRWWGLEETLSYNRRAWRPVERFLAELKARWLKETASLPASKEEHTYNSPPDQKFEYARAAELLPDELPQFQFFQPALRRTSRSILFRRQTWSAGDLLAVSRLRLLWITDRRGRTHEPYGTICRSAPVACLLQIRCRLMGEKYWAEVLFREGEQWRFPLSPGYEDAGQEFAKEVTRSISIGNPTPTPVRRSNQVPWGSHNAADHP